MAPSTSPQNGQTKQRIQRPLLEHNNLPRRLTVHQATHLEFLGIMSSRSGALEALEASNTLLQLQSLLELRRSTGQELVEHMIAPFSLRLVHDTCLLEQVVLDLLGGEGRVTRAQR